MQVCACIVTDNNYGDGCANWNCHDSVTVRVWMLYTLSCLRYSARVDALYIVISQIPCTCGYFIHMSEPAFYFQHVRLFRACNFRTHYLTSVQSLMHTYMSYYICVRVHSRVVNMRSLVKRTFVPAYVCIYVVSLHR